MAYNKHNDDLISLGELLLPFDKQDPDDTDLPPITPDDPEKCTCINQLIIQARVVCERSPTHGPDGLRIGTMTSGMITGFRFFGRISETAYCGIPRQHDHLVPKPGDTHTVSSSGGGSEEKCVWNMKTKSIKNQGKCECCGFEVGRVYTLSLRVTPGPSDVPGPEMRRWDWDGRGAYFLFLSLLRELKAMVPKPALGCCDTVGHTMGATVPDETILDSFNDEDLAESFQLAWDGQNSEIRGHKMNDSVVIKLKSLPTAGTNRGQFIMKDSAGNFIKYYVGDTVTHGSNTYSVIKATAGTHPKSDNASFQLVRKMNTNADGGVF